MGGLPAATKSHDDAAVPIILQGDKNDYLPSLASQYNHHQRFAFRGIAFLIFAFLLSGSYFRNGCWHWRSGSSLEIATDLGLPKEIQQAWAAHSPYFPAAEYVAPPAHCEVIQVNLIQRHGARFPTSKHAKRMQVPLNKLLDARFYVGEEYQFLEQYKYDLGVADLIPLGAQEASDAGFEHYLRYRHLIKDDKLPFVRAADSERVVLSASNWAQGFFKASDDMYLPRISVRIPEKKGSNNTLDGSQCPNAKADGELSTAWRDRFTPPIAKRINEAVPDANLDQQDVIELTPLCAFETLFHKVPSPFCDLFTAEEWQAREYYDDLTKYYKTGHGNPLGPVQGVGYVNELLARLTGQPVEDATQTNRTLTGSSQTFPLDRNFYADFSHDNQMIAIYSAIGLFRHDEPPTTDRLDPTRTFRISRAAPFSGRMITEKLRCGEHGGEYVRILVNDASQPLEFCGADEDGLCTLSAFVESQAYARNNGNGDWEKCFA